MKFNEIFDDSSTKMEIAVTFFALLELIKLKEIKVKQDDVFSEIYIYSNVNNDTETDIDIDIGGDNNEAD